MELLEFDVDEYNMLLNWFTVAFGQKNNATQADLELCEKVRVMARQYLKDLENNKKNI